MTGLPRPRARVVQWPPDAHSGEPGVYALRLTDMASEDRVLLLRAARDLGLWTWTDGEAVAVAGPADRLAGLSGAGGAAGEEAARALARFRTPPQRLEARGVAFDLRHRPLLVGILNVTPDSFYDGGRYTTLQAAVARAEAMVAEGADLVEVGGESARPGPPVSVDEEVRRVVPVVEALAGRLAVPVSVDTYKAEVAQRAVAAGAVLINDISGLADPRLAEVAAEGGAALVVMHIQGRPKVPQPSPHYRSLVDEVYAFLEDRALRAQTLGVPASRLLTDPGLSFGKAVHHDLEVLRRLGEFRSLGYPLYLATSRKNYVRDLLGLPPEELLEGTAAAVAYGVAQGAQFIRTHDVRVMARVVRTAHAIVRPPHHIPVPTP